MDLRGLEKGGKGGLAGPWINENKGDFNQHTIKVCVSYSWQCPSIPGFCSSGNNTRGELSPSRVRDRDEDIASSKMS